MFSNLDIFAFSGSFAIRKIRGCWFQILQYSFQIPVKKIPKQGIFGPKNRHFCFFSKFYNETNSMVLISSMRIVFSNSNPKIPKEGIFGPKIRHFCFPRNFTARQIWGRWFQIWQYYCKILAQTYPNKAFLVTKLGIFVFSRSLAVKQIRGCWFQIWQ